MRLLIVVVPGKDQRLVGELEQPLHGLPLRFGIARRQIGAAGRADEQRVARQRAVGQEEDERVRRVTGRAPDDEAQLAELQLLEDHVCSRCTFVSDACAVGVSTIRLMFTCGGRVVHQTIASATSSAVSGWNPA